MIKTIISIFILWSLAILAEGQTADKAFNRFGDFETALSNHNVDEAILIGEDLLSDTARLSAKTRINFYNGLAKMYEDNGQDAKAIAYYEKVAKAVPNYYVVHLALGYLYHKQSQNLVDKLNASVNNKQLHERLLINYYALIKKALPNLEKAQACDPDDQTLSIIKRMYQHINDQASLITLNARLQLLSKSCVDLLEVQ